MKRYALLPGLVLAVGGACLAAPPEEEVYAAKPAFCEPGFQFVEEAGYREVEHFHCKVVPDKRTKWVYCSKPDYFCVPACPLHGHHQDGCAHCQGPYCRPQLLKKKIEWECGTKCVVEVVKETVPCVVWRKVPCGPAQPAPGPERLPPPTGSAPPPANGAPR
jgi:hypothetical protein